MKIERYPCGTAALGGVLLGFDHQITRSTPPPPWVSHPIPDHPRPGSPDPGLPDCAGFAQSGMAVRAAFARAGVEVGVHLSDTHVAPPPSAVCSWASITRSPDHPIHHPPGGYPTPSQIGADFDRFCPG